MGRKKGGPRSATFLAILEVVGTKPDAAIARDFGVTRSYVGQVRNSYTDKPSGPRHRHLETASSLLGIVPDADIAAIVGISASAIRGMRQRAGIAAAPCPPRTHSPAPKRDAIVAALAKNGPMTTTALEAAVPELHGNYTSVRLAYLANLGVIVRVGPRYAKPQRWALPNTSLTPGATT